MVAPAHSMDRKLRMAGAPLGTGAPQARTQPAIPQEFQSSTNSVYVAFDVLIGEAEDVRDEPSSFFKAREKTLLA
jgi:hypothetical protein